MSERNAAGSDRTTPSPEPEISIVIPTFNRAGILDRCLAHIEGQTVPPTTYEVIVADDASTDETSEVVHRWATRLPCLQYLPCPKGFAGAARNRGASVARGARLLFLGDDILAAADLVEQHVAGERRHGPNAVLVGEVTLDGARPLPPFMAYLEESGLHHDFPTLRASLGKPIPGRYFYACNASVPRAAFERCGGFDETIRRAWEDSELGLRLDCAGYPLYFFPDARGLHVHPTSFSKYVSFRRLGRGDVASAILKMRALGEPIPPAVPHPVLDAMSPDWVVDRLVRLVERIEDRLPLRTRHLLYRRVIRYETRRALLLADQPGRSPRDAPGSAADERYDAAVQ